MSKQPTKVTVEPAKAQITGPAGAPASQDGSLPQDLGPAIPSSGNRGSGSSGKKRPPLWAVIAIVLLAIVAFALTTVDSPSGTDETVAGTPPTPTPVAEQAPLVIQGDGSPVIQEERGETVTGTPPTPTPMAEQMPLVIQGDGSEEPDPRLEELLNEGVSGAQDALSGFLQQTTARLSDLKPDELLAVFAKAGWKIPDNDTTLLQGGIEAMKRNQVEQGSMFENCPPPPPACAKLGIDGWLCFQLLQYLNGEWQLPLERRGSAEVITSPETSWDCPPR